MQGLKLRAEQGIQHSIGFYVRDFKKNYIFISKFGCLTIKTDGWESKCEQYLWKVSLYFVFLLCALGKPQCKKKRKSSDNVTKGPSPLPLVTAWRSRADPP